MQSNLANYLPLTGGTVSGNVTVSGAVTHNGESFFYGNPNYTNEAGHIFGVNNNDWKHLGMYGYGANAGGFEAFAEDSPNNAQGFTCKARGTNGEHYDLTGRSDGTLQWAGRHVVRSVNGTVAGTDGNVTLGVGVYLKEKWVSGTQWYRVWSDGWKEQGGHVNVAFGATVTVTLHLSMRNTNYTILEGSHGGSESTIRINTDQTTTSFRLARHYTGNGRGNGSAYWYVCGY